MTGNKQLTATLYLRTEMEIQSQQRKGGLVNLGCQFLNTNEEEN